MRFLISPASFSPPPLGPLSPSARLPRAELRQLRQAKLSEKSPLNVGNIVGKTKPATASRTPEAEGGAGNGRAKVGAPRSLSLLASF